MDTIANAKLQNYTLQVLHEFEASGTSLNSFGFPSLELCKAHQYQYRSQHPAAAAIDVARQREQTLQTGRFFDKSTSFIFFTRTGALAVPALKSQTGAKNGKDVLGPE